VTQGVKSHRGQHNVRRQSETDVEMAQPLSQKVQCRLPSRSGADSDHAHRYRDSHFRVLVRNVYEFPRYLALGQIRARKQPTERRSRALRWPFKHPVSDWMVSCQLQIGLCAGIAVGARIAPSRFQSGKLFSGIILAGRRRSFSFYGWRSCCVGSPCMSVDLVNCITVPSEVARSRFL